MTGKIKKTMLLLSAVPLITGTLTACDKTPETSQNSVQSTVSEVSIVSDDTSEQDSSNNDSTTASQDTSTNKPTIDANLVKSKDNEYLTAIKNGFL